MIRRTYSKQRSFATEDPEEPHPKRRRLSPPFESVSSSSPRATSSSPPPVQASNGRNLISSPPTSPPPSSPANTRECTILAEIVNNKVILPPPALNPLKRLRRTSSAPTKPNNPKRNLTQLTLDLGGPVRRRCKECGMEYLPSTPEDSALHKRFHAQSLGGVDISKTLLTDAINTGVAKLARSHTSANKISSKGRMDLRYIISVDAGSSPKYRRMVERVLGIVETELGAVPIVRERLWGDVASETSGVDQIPTSSSRMGKHRYKALILVQGVKCVGFCLSERVSRAFFVVDDGRRQDLAAGDGVHKPESSSITVSQDSVADVLGISRIWVSSTVRMQGIARALLDYAQSTAWHGGPVEKAKMAFSQPTYSGGKLARKWFGKESGWLVYDG